MNAQQFTAFLQAQDYNVHGVEAVRDMLLAHTEGGCAYTRDGKVLYVEGEQQGGELRVERIVQDTTGELCNLMHGEYELEGDALVVIYDETYDEYANNEDGWADAASTLMNWIA